MNERKRDSAGKYEKNESNEERVSRESVFENVCFWQVRVLEVDLCTPAVEIPEKKRIH